MEQELELRLTEEQIEILQECLKLAETAMINDDFISDTTFAKFLNMKINIVSQIKEFNR